MYVLVYISKMKKRTEKTFFIISEHLKMSTIQRKTLITTLEGKKHEKG